MSGHRPLVLGNTMHLADTLSIVESLLDTNSHREAEAQLHRLLAPGRDKPAPGDMQVILRLIGRFHHKRRRDLTELLTRRFGPIDHPPSVQRAHPPLSPPDNPQPIVQGRTVEEVHAASSTGAGVNQPTDSSPRSTETSGGASVHRLKAFRSSLHSRLHQLSDQHIFQWSTFYRDYFGGDLFPSLLSAASHAPEDLPGLAEVIADEISQHSIDIFQKGYSFTAAMKVGGHQYAINKSVAGLQRFLELPLELYSGALRSVPSSVLPMTLRVLCASMVRGILCGYASATLGQDSGKQVLPVRQRSWVHYVPFLTYKQLVATLNHIEPGPLLDNLKEVVLPALGTFDRLAQGGAVSPALPILGQYDWVARRLDVVLRSVELQADPRPVEIQCYLDAAYAGTAALEESDHRGIAVVLAPLKADVEEWARNRPSLADRLIDVSHFAHDAEAQVLSAIAAAFSRRISSSSQGLLTYNFARDFPLKSAQIPPYFHIYRRSVRDLLRTFERRNGVRVWCSVRRSGKTTACSDLGAPSSDSCLIAQTCQDTEGRQDSTLLYSEVRKALDSGTRLSDEFLVEIVESCGPGRRRGDGRFVLMLDEYEVLFGDLRTAVADSEAAKYRVALPLLNQLVQFSRQNLLVLVGQEPDAHHILMDRNQLSAYVEQDGFPLFNGTDDGEGSEFGALVRKVISDRVLIDRDVERLVFRETGGHPFLAANLLVEFVDWMIEARVPGLTQELTAGHYETFAKTRLAARRLTESVEYGFFRGAAREALGTVARRRSPWLHSQYTLLRLMAVESPDSLSLSRDDLTSLVERKGADRSSRFSVSELLVTGARANFLELDGECVRPKIPLLARLSGLVIPGI